MSEKSVKAAEEQGQLVLRKSQSLDTSFGPNMLNFTQYSELTHNLQMQIHVGIRHPLALFCELNGEE